MGRLELLVHQRTLCELRAHEIAPKLAPSLLKYSYHSTVDSPPDRNTPGSEEMSIVEEIDFAAIPMM